MSRTRPPKAVRSILYIHWKLRYYPSNNPMNYLATNVTKKLDHNNMNDEVRQVDQLLCGRKVLTGKKENESRLIMPEEVFYLEIVERKLYVYLEKEVWQLEGGLQEVTDDYEKYGLVRISKSMAVNIGKVKNITSDINARIRLRLLNNEVVIMNRAYRKNFYQRLNEWCEQEREKV